MKKTVLLVAFYNVKALGVRYLETALKEAGYHVVTVFFKTFHSQSPKKCSQAEIEHLIGLIHRYQPVLAGLSVMSSMYLDTVNDLLETIKKRCELPLCVGGAFASMMPAYFTSRGAEYVIRGDGERAICRLADAIVSGETVQDIPSLCYRTKDGLQTNEIGDIALDIDTYGLPAIECMDAYLIENDRLEAGDPQLSTRAYEVIASRGCPFTCSYCCCVNLHRMMPKGTPAVRSRSVQSVIDELKLAKKKCPKLVYVHFYDEIFPTVPGWIDTFVTEYKKHIGLPFTIWSHPKMVREDTLRKLRDAGLMEVIMGIQSGSDTVRREVFHRYESREDILEASRTIRRCGIFWASYDFMLGHPFESVESMKETYFLAKELTSPFELQLHGLNFLPGTDIVDMTVDAGLVTREEMDRIMYAPMSEQFSAYWKREEDAESRLWYQMTYLLQFSFLRRRLQRYESDPSAHAKQIADMYARGLQYYKLRYLYRKTRIALKGFLGF